MPGNRRILMAMLVVLALSGCALTLLSGVGDAGVMAAAGALSAALDTAGQADNGELRDALHATIARLQSPWAMVNLIGFVVLSASLVGIVAVWRARG